MSDPKPKYGERIHLGTPAPDTIPANQPEQKDWTKGREPSKFGMTMVAIIIGIPLLAVCIPLCVLLTRLALGG